MLSKLARMVRPAVPIEITRRGTGYERTPAKLFGNERGILNLPDSEDNVEAAVNQCGRRVCKSDFNIHIGIGAKEATQSASQGRAKSRMIAQPQSTHRLCASRACCRIGLFHTSKKPQAALVITGP